MIRTRRNKFKLVKGKVVLGCSGLYDGELLKQVE